MTKRSMRGSSGTTSGSSAGSAPFGLARRRDLVVGEVLTTLADLAATWLTMAQA